MLEEPQPLHTILDLDVDFFVRPTVHLPSWNGRAPARQYKRLSIKEVRDFLERQCNLRRGEGLPGAQVIEHVDSFWTWKRWIQEGKLEVPFRVIHVDAHADIGLGDAGFIYLLTEVLALPVEARSNPVSSERSSDMNSGNYLAFAVANRWVHDILYVYPSGERFLNADAGIYERDTPENGNLIPADLLAYHFRDFEPRTHMFELKQYTKEDVRFGIRKSREPVSIEPAIPFDWISGNRFRFGGFTHIVVAQSPKFTPKAADALLPVIADYYMLS